MPLFLNQAKRRGTFPGGRLFVVLFVAGAAALLLPTLKAQDAPQLFFVMGGKTVELSPQAQGRIVGQMEGIIRSINATSEENPGKFKGDSYRDLTPKVLKENGSYFQVSYPQEKAFSTPAGTVRAKDFYIGIVPYANVPGVPGGLFLVGADQHIIYLTCDGDLMGATADIALDPEVFPHLGDMMRRNLAWGFFEHLDRAKEKNLSPEYKLARAVKNGDLAGAKKLLDGGVDVHELLPGKATLLFAAGSPEMAEFLLQRGIKVDARNEEGNTALIEVCHNDNWRRPQERVVPIARALLKHGANPNATGAGSWSPLMVAHDGPTVDVLVEFGADVHAKPNGQGPLDELDLGYRDLSYYQALAAHGLPIDNLENGMPLLVFACRSWQTDFVAWLLERGVDPNGSAVFDAQYPKYRFTQKPLTEAAAGGSAVVAKLLIDHGARVDDDAVECAIRNDRGGVIKVFWENGAKNISELFNDVNQNAPVGELEALLKSGMPADPPEDKFESPLALAAMRGNFAAVQALVEHGADPNRKIALYSGDPQFNFAEWTPLAAAASGGHENVVRYLLQHGAHPSPDTLKATLYCFYHRGQGAPPDEIYHQIVQELVDGGAGKNVPREKMAELLLWTGSGAGDWYDVPSIKILLAAGLDPTAQDTKGRNAIDMVQARYAKISDAQTRAHLHEVIALFKGANAASAGNGGEK